MQAPVHASAMPRLLLVPLCCAPLWGRCATPAPWQVGSYAFTTLRPQLGTLQYADGLALVAADVPGLLRGAHANKGRGNQFLRHIEQCRCCRPCSSAVPPGAGG